jgi:hypothetical protein
MSAVSVCLEDVYLAAGFLCCSAAPMKIHVIKVITSDAVATHLMPLAIPVESLKVFYTSCK